MDLDAGSILMLMSWAKSLRYVCTHFHNYAISSIQYIVHRDFLRNAYYVLKLIVVTTSLYCIVSQC